ncbi:MAG: S46 family peptidase, partial [Deltaproteobacteria bacterium]|nr:S46 family peptidase [Deltaproteobacteria bacterium]
LLDKLPAKDLKRSGLKIPVAKLGELSRAVVQVARGGSGSFVSKEGLLVTNHHVAYGCLTRLDAKKAHKGLMQRGYIATSRAKELPCPGYDMLVVERMEDVTAKVKEGLPRGSRRNFKARFKQLRRAKEALRVACEEEQKGSVCEVSQMDGGRLYYLSVYKRIRDVRLVYAPPAALGKFGGDIDNWMFPRHSADFTFLRAYTNAKGMGASYAKGNVPLSTPVHLTVSKQGVKKKSLVLVMGFPGRTSRHAASHRVRYQQAFVMPQVLKLFEGALKVLATRAAQSDEAKRKYASLDARLNNGLKYFKMSKAGFTKWKLLENKLAAEAALKKSERFNKAGGAGIFAEMGRIYAKAQRLSGTYSNLEWLTRMVSTVRVAYNITRWGREKGLADTERPDNPYKDKNVYRFKEAAQRLEAETEPQTERALLTYFIRQAQQLPRHQRVEAVTWLMGWARKEERATRRAAKKAGMKDTKAFYTKRYGVKPSEDVLERAVQMVFAKSQLVQQSGDKKAIAAVAFRKKAFTLDAKALSKLKDPLLIFASKLDKQKKELRDGPFAVMEKYLGAVLRERWVEAKGSSYPDANFTLRLSYGSVRDYTATATGKTHRYITALTGVVAKHQGKKPFNVPSFLREAHKKGAGKASPYRDAEIDDVPVDFTCTLDTTGGNSGSAVLDDHGRLVGLLFDGTPESILSDWQYLHKEQRSIVVDIRYALFLAQLQGAKALLEELAVSR